MSEILIFLLWAILIPVLALVATVYFLPTIVAVVRRHPRPIFLGFLNLAFGVTVIGWVILLIWAIFGTTGHGSLTRHLSEAERLFKRGRLSFDEYQRYRQRHIDND